MTEEMLGYAEGIFLLFAITLMSLLAWRAYKPSSRKTMEEHGRIPFLDEDDS